MTAVSIRMGAAPKLVIVRDQKWIDHLKTEPCILTGYRGGEFMSVDPLHIGTLGARIKSSDDECLPVRHDLHALGHQKGEMTMFREHIPDWVLREALRLFAKRMYENWIP